MVGEAGIEPTTPGLEGPSGPFPLGTLNYPTVFCFNKLGTFPQIRDYLYLLSFSR